MTNVRPGALRRLGFDFESVAAANPRLVYGLITGYGETGPDADRAAYDIAAFWSRAGVAHLLTRPGDTPPFQRGGMGDHAAGMTLAAAICAALVARDRTGSGQLVTTSLYRQGAYTVSFDLNTYLMTGYPIAVGQRETMGNPCMNNYAAGDGRRFWIVGLRSRPALAAVVPGRRPRRLADRFALFVRAVTRRQRRRADCRAWTGSLPPSPLTNGRRSSRVNRTSSGRRSTRSRMSLPTSSSTPPAA